MNLRKNIQPIFDDLILTADKESFDESGILMPDTVSTIKVIQTVIAKGPAVPDYINVGDTIEINPETFKYEYKKQKHDLGEDLRIPIVPLFKSDDGNFLKITTRQILWIIKK
jgi:co-chaperonin GroES (HSP10)